MAVDIKTWTKLAYGLVCSLYMLYYVSDASIYPTIIKYHE
jgi:hypothetical protein